MPEPHELEERVARLVDPEKWREIDECAAISAADPASRKCATCPLIAEKSLETARTALSLVKIEQMKLPTDAMLLEGARTWTDEDYGEHERAIYAAMIRAWWLSHTAKETSNG